MGIKQCIFRASMQRSTWAWLQRKENTRDACKKCKDNVWMTYTDDENYTPPPVAVPHPAMLLDTTIHYSFAMAQQVRNFPTINMYFTYYRFTIRVIPYSLGQSTSSHWESVQSLASIAKAYKMGNLVEDILRQAPLCAVCVWKCVVCACMCVYGCVLCVYVCVYACVY